MKPPSLHKPAKRKPWSTSDRSKSRHERGYGNDHYKMRAHLIQTVTLCEECRRNGRVEVGKIADHIIPLTEGGTGDRDNYQLLCEQCHAMKSAKEAASGAVVASTHPTWLKRSAIPLTIVCGPPCAGKTTYVAEHAHPADLVIDMDAIAAGLDPLFRPWQPPRGNLVARALRSRNTMLGFLAKATAGRAWFIVSAPSRDEREWWRERLGGEVVLLDPGEDECKRRAVARGTPRAVRGVDAWHMAAQGRWEPKKSKAVRRPSIE